MTSPDDHGDDGIVPWTDEGDSDVTDQVKDTFAREAERVEVTDRWSEISAAARATRRRRPWVVVGAAAVALLAGVGIGGLVLQDRITTGPAGPPVQTSTTASPTPSRTAEPPPTPDQSTATPSATGSPTERERPSADPSTPAAPDPEPSGDTEPVSGVAIYFLGDSRSGTWLYREFRTVPGAEDEVTAAVNGLLGADPQDGDYHNPWQSSGESAEVTRDGADLVIDLPAGSFGSEVDTDTAEAAVQQLVWTATAAAGTEGTVTITVDGEAYEAWGSVALGEPMRRAGDVRAPIWITDPTEGQTDHAGTVTVLGSSTSFEGNVQWKITEAGSKEVVEDGFTTGGSNGDFGDFEFSTDLEPGRYTVTVYAEDQSDGESAEGPVMFPDSKTWTVQ